MPKIKTHRGAAKRFKKTSGGKVRYRKSYRGHILTSKSPKRKRQLRKNAVMTGTMAENIKRILPYS